MPFEIRVIKDMLHLKNTIPAQIYVTFSYSRNVDLQLMESRQ